MAVNLEPGGGVRAAGARRSGGVPLVLFTFLKFLANALLRLPYPFLEDIAKGLHRSESAVGSMLGFGEVAGLGASFVGSDLDRGRHRRWAVAGYGVTAAGGVVIGVLRSAPGLVVGFCLVAIGINLVTTTIHTYIGEHVPFRERGRAIGIFEMSWALSLLIGGVFAGLLIDRTSWAAPFVVTGLLLLVTTPLVYRAMEPPPVRIPTTGERASAHGSVVSQTGASDSFTWAAPLRAISVSVLATVAQVLTFSTFGSFLADHHHFGTAQRGGVVAAIGAMELLGSGGTAVLTDRLGTVNAVVLGMAVMGAATAALLLLGMGTVSATVVAIVLFFLGFEYGYVSLLAIVSEVGGVRRGFVVAVDHAAVTIARGLGAAVGPWLTGSDSQHFRMVQLIVLVLVAGTAVVVFPLRHAPELQRSAG